MNNFLKNNKGLTLVEILVASVVSSITVAVIYFSFGIFSGSYSGIISKVQVSRDIRNALTLVSKDVRAAGYTSRIPAQSNGYTFAPFSTLNTKIIIQKNSYYNGNRLPGEIQTSNSSDLIEVIYDQNRNTRVKVSYTRSNDGYLVTRLVRCLDTDCLNFDIDVNQGFYNFSPIANQGLEAFRVAAFDSNGLPIPNIHANQAHFIRVSVLYSSANNGEVHKTEQQQIFNVEDFRFSATDRFFRDMGSVLIYPRNIQALK